MKRRDPFRYGISDLNTPQSGESRKSVANLHELRDWDLFWRGRRRESGVLEVDLIARVPETSPGLPDSTEVMEIFRGCSHHVKSKPVFMCARSGWSYGVLVLTAQECSIQPLLLGVGSECGCDTWLNPSDTRKVYESLCKGLKRLNEIGYRSTHVRSDSSN